MIFKPLFSTKWNTRKKMFQLTKVSTFLVFLYCEERKSVSPEKTVISILAETIKSTHQYVIVAQL